MTRSTSPSQILRQAEVALRERRAHHFPGGRAREITAPDRDLARMLQRLGKPVTLAVNKADTGAREDLANEFYELGIADVYPVSAEHGTGVDALLDHVTAGIRRSGAKPKRRRPRRRKLRSEIKVAIIGRPNVGKSTLLNTLTGQERAIVSPIAGTTRDAVDEKVSRDGVDYVFVDTAGIRHKGKTKLMAEKLSVVMARRHIRMAHVVLLVLDATEGVVGLDATIAGYAHEGGRALILCVNKWDEVKGRGQSQIRARSPRPVQIPGLRAGGIPLRQDRRGRGAAVPGRSARRTNRRRGAFPPESSTASWNTALRRAQDSTT